MPFLPERVKIKRVEELVDNLHDKTEYVIHVRNSKQAKIMGYFWKKFVEWLNLIKMLG